MVHANDLADRPEQFSDDFRAILGYGAGLPAVRLVRAQRDIAAAQQRIRVAFADLDAVVMPTTPQTAFDFSEAVPVNQADLTAIANLTDRPAVSVPMGFADNGLPLGLQLVGPRFGEAATLRYARAYELAAGHDMRLRDSAFA